MDKSGHFWGADTHYIGGQTFFADSAVINTDIPNLYQTERWNDPTLADNLKYTLNVRPGDYRVNLHFAEVFFQTAGQRVFSVDINGASAIENLDIAAEVGPNAALIKTITARAVDGKITIGFRNGIENAKISAIEIVPAGTVINRVARALPAVTDMQVKAIGAGSLSVRSASGAAFTAMVRDSKGKSMMVLRGPGSKVVSGLRSGIYLVVVRSAGRSVTYRVAVP